MSHPEGGAQSKLRSRFGRHPRRGPVQAWLVLLVIGIALAVTGLALLISQPGTSSTPVRADVSLTAVLEASEQGALEKVDMPGGTRPATGTLSQDMQQGRLVDELGKPLVAGATFRFYVDSAAVAAVTAQFIEEGVAVWMGQPIAIQGVTRGFVPGSTRVVTTEENTSPAWVVPVGVILLLTGLVLIALGITKLVTSRQRRKANEEAEQARRSASVTKFKDVAGADEAVEQMRELVDFVLHPERYRAAGAKMPKGALLVGPPGTGKTLLAKALAGECDVPLISASGSEFVEMYVGVGPKRVRELFSRARRHGTAIIFIDEVDAVARKRSGENESQGNHESENTLIALLTEMDGFSTTSNVVVIAATNRPDILDPALTRPGRLDRRIEVPLPDRRGREGILAVHARDVPLAEDADLSLIARRTPGFSGAQLASVVNEAAIASVRGGETLVSQAALDAAVATVAMGRPRLSALVTDFDRKVTAWHEAGHTVAALLLKDADEPVAVSIVPRGPAGGVTWMSGTDEQFLTRAKAHARLVVALGGRAAEQMLLDGEFTQGASGDLQSATETALLMATRYGMTELGLASRGEHLGGTTTKEVAEVVELLLAEAHGEATALLRDHRALVEAIAEALLDREDLSAVDLRRIAQDHGVTPAAHPTPVPDVPKPVRRKTGSATTELPALEPTPPRTRIPVLLMLRQKLRPKAKA